MNYYSENLIDSLDNTITDHPMFEEWYEIVEKILLSDEFQKRKLFMHHHDMSVWDHSTLVSFKAFLLARLFGADAKVCAIAGVLHDFYDQAWISTPEIEKLDDGIHATYMKQKKKFFEKHGFIHARKAVENYLKYFPEYENKRITNSILRHMFPLNIIPPRYKEGWIITYVDKINSVRELPSLSVVPKTIKSKFLKILDKES